MKSLKITALFRVWPVILSVLVFTGTTWAGETRVDILFMNHGPMQPVIGQIKEILATSQTTVRATWHEVETPEGLDFMKRMNVNGHIPLLIFINGSPTKVIGGRQVSFSGFPAGFGPYMFQGTWEMEDLRTVLQAPGEQP